MNKTLLKTIFGIMLITMILVSGCQIKVPEQNTGNTNSQFTLGDSSEVKNFESVEDLKAFIASSRDSGYSGPVYATDSIMKSSEESMAPTAGRAEGTSMDSGNDYSGTNVQVQGVDEADTLKTDGEYIYTLTGNVLFIIKAYPGEEAKVVSKVELTNNYPQGLFVKGNKLAVFGTASKIDYEKLGFIPREGMTYFNIYDISNKEDPKLEKEYLFEGYYQHGRMKDSTAFIVLNSAPEARPIPMPYIVEDNVKRNVAIDDVSYFDMPYTGAMFSTVHGIDLNSEEISDSETVAIQNYASIYMSEDNLYLVYSKYINQWEIEQDITISVVEPRLLATDKQLIQKIRSADSDLLNNYEKKSKISQIVNNYINYLSYDEQQKIREEVQKKVEDAMSEYEYNEYSVINRLQIGNDITVKASGIVPGNIMNQFSMDEDNEVFRIATTANKRYKYDYGYGSGGIAVREGVAMMDSQVVATEPEMMEKRIAADSMIAPMPPQQQVGPLNNVYALDMDLEVLDKLEGLAVGESIFSARFVGDRLYLVTFRQVDPFFVIDLSNPRAIKSLGELKIPGFSRYLHPYDADTIIGLGQETTKTGAIEGIKISLFDVKDPSKPKEIAKFVTKEDYANTIAQFEHKAFLFSKEKELLVIPAQNGGYYNYVNGWGPNSDSYNGALVFKITKNEITLRGLVDHSKGKGAEYYGNGVERSLYIQDLLYTKSPTLLRINEISDLSSVKNIDLDSSSKYGGEIPIY